MTVSGSDEAIVSINLAGQHNRLASQGPLDRIVPGNGSAKPKGACPSGPSVALDDRYSGRVKAIFAKGMVEFLFEAVLGKTRRTEF